MFFRKYAFSLVMISVLLAASTSYGQGVSHQVVPFSSSPQAVGSGARAAGWANAFIAVADDATAASWNPGGLVQLVKPETSVAVSYHSRIEELDFAGLDAYSDSETLSSVNINYASVVYPFEIKGRNLVVSLNYQRMYEFDRDLDYGGSGVLAGGDVWTEARSIKQLGSVTTLTPAFCVEITPKWSMGASVNIWGLDGENDGWEQEWDLQIVTRNDAGLVIERTWAETWEKYSLSGVNYVIGTQYKTNRWTFAAVYKTRWDADVDFEKYHEQASHYPLDPSMDSHASFEADQSETLTWPESYGVGVAFRYSDRLSFALDAYATRWSEYVLEDEEGNEINLLAMNDVNADVKDDAFQVHFGTEYLWILPKYAVAARGGLFYDPQPIEDTVNETYGLAVGGGVAYRNLAIDAAFQYRWGEGMEGEQIENMKSEMSLSDYFAIVSVIYHL